MFFRRWTPQADIPRSAGGGSSSGFTLLEMVVVLAVFAAGLNLCMALLASGARLTALNTLALDRMQACTDIQVVFLESVHEAVAVAEGVGEHRTGTDKAVLALPSRGGHRRWLLLGNLYGDGRWMKAIVAESEAGLVSEFAAGYGLPMETIRFQYDANPVESSRLITLDLAIRPERGEHPSTAPIHRYMAALGGIAAALGEVGI